MTVVSVSVAASCPSSAALAAAERRRTPSRLTDSKDLPLLHPQPTP